MWILVSRPSPRLVKIFQGEKILASLVRLTIAPFVSLFFFLCSLLFFSFFLFSFILYTFFSSFFFFFEVIHYLCGVFPHFFWDVASFRVRGRIRFNCLPFKQYNGHAARFICGNATATEIGMRLLINLNRVRLWTSIKIRFLQAEIVEILNNYFHLKLNSLLSNSFLTRFDDNRMMDLIKWDYVSFGQIEIVIF